MQLFEDNNVWGSDRSMRQKACSSVLDAWQASQLPAWRVLHPFFCAQPVGPFRACLAPFMSTSGRAHNHG
jgi:hypothetical protein